MEMITEEIRKDYYERTIKLRNLFYDNLLRASTEMVVEDSSVDYSTYKFVFSIYNSYIQSIILFIEFWLAGMPMIEDDLTKMSKRIEEFHSMEKELASQNDTLEKLTEKISDTS